MDGFLTAAVTVPVAGLVAWRWWLADKAAARSHELALKQQAERAEDAMLRALPARVQALELAVKEAAWRK
jgi:hypothetical protein